MIFNWGRWVIRWKAACARFLSQAKTHLKSHSPHVDTETHPQFPLLPQAKITLFLSLSKINQFDMVKVFVPQAIMCAVSRPN